MSWAVKAELTGLRDVLGRVQRLGSQTVRSRVTRKAVDKASQPAAKTMKRLAPASEQGPLIPGLLKKSVGRKIKVYRNSGIVVMVVGPRSGFRRVVGSRKDGRPIVQNPTKYAHLVEYGHGGPAPAPPHPFARPTWDQTRSSAEAILRSELLAGVEAEARG